MKTVSPVAIRQEKDRLRAVLAEHGIDDVLLGAEVEYSRFPPTLSTEHSERIKSQIVNSLEEQIQGVEDRRSRADLAARQVAIREFNAREVMMYDLLADPRVSHFFEPLFGVTGENCYYDAAGVLEKKTKPFDESVVSDRINLIKAVLREKAEQFGFDPEIAEAGTVHLSFSFHNDKGNIFAPDTRDPGLMAKIVAGASYALRGAADYLDGYSRLGNRPSVGAFRAHPGREHKIRIAPNRMELRLNKMLGEIDVDAITMVVLAGAAYGLKPKDVGYFNDNVPQVQLVKALEVETKDPSRNVLLHTLQGCIVGDDGYLIPPGEYIYESFAVKGGGPAIELGLEPKGSVCLDEVPSAEVIKNNLNVMSSESLEDVLSNTRVVPVDGGGYALQWPNTRMLFQVVTHAPISMDYAVGYDDGQTAVSDLSPRVPFDASVVAQKFTVTGLRMAVVSETRMAPDEVRVDSISQNRALQEYLSPDVHRAIAYEHLGEESRYLHDEACAASVSDLSPERVSAVNGLFQRMLGAVTSWRPVVT